MSEKTEIRQAMKAWRETLSSDWISKASIRICERAMILIQQQQAHSIACYLSLPQEVQTQRLIDYCFEKNISVSVPCQRDDQYQLGLLVPSMAMRSGRYGILEPEMFVPTEEVAIVFCPGLAFDRTGHRLGYGFGYYDKFLSQLFYKPLRVGLCFGQQVVKAIPTQKSDIAMNFVLTETELIAV